MNIDQASQKQTPISLISGTELLIYADHVVSKYVSQGIIPEREKDDVRMSIVERFWKKLDHITANYSGGSKITTYCSAVLNNMCCEVIRKDLIYWKYKSEEYIREDYSNTFSSLELLLIKDEVLLLDKIIRLLEANPYKVKVFLAYFYRLQPKRYLIEEFAMNGKSKEIMELLNPADNITKAQLFDNLAKTIRLCEEKYVQADAVRMWLNKILNTIIERLNGPFLRANYDKNSFRTLFEYYYIENDY